MIKRDLLPEEVAEIAALAIEFSDLRAIRPMITKLHERNEELTNIKLDAIIVRPTSIKDLVLLLEKDVVTLEWVRARLPDNGIDPTMEPMDIRPIEGRSAGNENAGPSSMGQKADGILTLDPGYTVKDKRAPRE